MEKGWATINTPDLSWITLLFQEEHKILSGDWGTDLSNPFIRMDPEVEKSEI